MALVDVQRQFEYWRDRPPKGRLISVIAQFVGWTPPSRKMPVVITSEAALDALIAEAGKG